MKFEIKNLAVLGAGFMGLQIAATAAFAGNRVKVFDENPEARNRAAAELNKAFFLTGQQGQENKLAAVLENIEFCTTIADAVSGSDLVIEAVKEDLEVKRQVLKKAENHSPVHSIIASNSSSIPIIKIEKNLARPQQVINLHFDSPMLQRPMVDIMPGNQTSEKTVNTSIDWVGQIGCSPVLVKKPIMGYLGNRLWRMVKRESLMLWAEGYGDFTEIDRSWMLQFGTDLGPFAMMDAVGLDVVYDIEMAYYQESKKIEDKPPEALRQMIDKNELGLKTNKGFYNWNDPEFLKPGFLGLKKSDENG